MVSKIRLAFVLAFALLLPGLAQAARDDMRFTDVYVEAESDNPRACFRFTRKLAAHGDVHYGDYLRFTPEFKAEFSVNERNICVSGMQHGTIYSATLLKGIPDYSGRRTENTETFNVSMPDRRPNLNFSASSYFLPSRGERALPLTAVNVTEADVSILRVNDRNLINEINAGRISRLLSSWDSDRIASTSGETVWEGIIEIAMEKNKEVKTSVPVGDLLGKPEPGIYIVMAKPRVQGRGYSYYEATQWMVVTDIGISSITGRDGLHVFLRSLGDAAMLAGTKVQLVARNNEVLATATTDEQGMAVFDPGLTRGKGGARPGAVLAFGKNGEFSFLDLTKPGFDLTDRGVGGRAEPGPVDAFVYTDRGVYRPGETVNIVTMVRDSDALAQEGAPLKLRFVKPDGTEHSVVDMAAMGIEAAEGGYHLPLPLSKGANTGTWTVQALLDPKEPAVGSATFQVEDFVPERMEVKLSSEAAYVAPGGDYGVSVDARFLYGAPGANLAVKGEMVLMPDPNPWPELKGYRFGLVQEEWRPRRLELPATSTDAEGKASMKIALEEAPDTSLPLKARVRVAVEEQGGRAVARFIDLPVRAQPLAIGIRPLFDREWLANRTEAGFEVVALDRDGKPAAASGLKYQLFEEHWHYRWYTEDGDWRYRITIEDEQLDSGKLDLAAGKPGKLGFTKDWGYYRLEVSDPKSGVASSVRFRYGWYMASVSSDVPDKLELTLDNQRYAAGAVAKVHVRPPFAGEMLLTVSGNKVYETRNITVPADGVVVELPVAEDWDAGAYVTATLFRTAESGKPHQPSRAIGLAWIGRDHGKRTLDVSIDAPERITPRQTIDVGVKIGNVPAGQQAHVTLAAVDVGILQLTNFKTPAPADWYFGKRRLGVELRDGYGHLIASAEGGPVKIRQGGDEGAEGRHLGGLDASSVKTVSLFSGVVAVGKGGIARVPLDIPDFNGRLRLMAVAWSKSAVGSGEQDMTVRDPVVTQVTLPRFMAPGDQAQVNVSVHNLDGPEGKYKLSFTATGSAGMKGGGQSLAMNRDARHDVKWTLSGDGVGVGDLTLTVEGPEGFKLVREWQIAVRPAQAVVTKQISARIQSHQSSTVSGSAMDDFVPGTGEALLTLSARPEMGLADLLKSLSRYPYGCAEQTTSRAMPLLYVSDIAKSLGIAEDEVFLRSQVEGAIHRLLTMQRADGSFGLWSAQSPREEWLSAYVMDFLTQAKELKYPVPEFPYRRGLEWLKSAVSEANYSRANLPSRVYALYVLTRAGEAKVSDLRYVYDVQFSSVPTAMARAQLGAALALAGEKRRAGEAFQKATASWERASRFWGDWWYWDYGTSARDMAATLYLATHAKVEDGDWIKLAQDLSDRIRETRYFSTQEKSWMVMAAYEMGNGDPIRVGVKGKSLPASDRPVYLHFSDAEMKKGIDVANHGDKPIWQSVTYSGVPRDEMPAEDAGFAIFRSFYTMEGKRADLAKVRQGDTLVAVIQGESTGRRDQQAMVVDLLPAGFEIENERLEGGRDREELRWLGRMNKAKHEEFRDDRYVAAFDINSRDTQTFKFAYLVRAVSPGEFVLPAVYVEDMYKPTYFARTAMGRVTILPSK